MKKLKIYFYLFVFISSVNSSYIKADVYLENFNLDDVLKSGRNLMALDYGLHYLEPQSNNQKKLFIGVHGSNSEGYEWIYPYLTIDSSITLVAFFRYNDNFCPNRAYIRLNNKISSILDKKKNIDEVILMGHSYGAMIVAMFSDKWTKEIPLTIHTVAGPLTGPISSNLRSSLFRNICDYYPPYKIRDNVAFYQWRTIKELDGAFNDLEYDPQIIDLKGSSITRLPDTYNGRRLGHNWSLSWVAEQISE
tara:strand:- start:52 stop:798 length:747 start_codon:yes stop_codon:yes gene_type:complete